MLEGNIEISNKGLRAVTVMGDKLVFLYEDGRVITVTFTSSRRAGKYFYDNYFVKSNDPPESFILEGVVNVEYGDITS
jgi:hypothetical protein